MINNEILVNQIVERVLQELNTLKNDNLPKKLVVSNCNDLKDDEVSYLEYNQDDRYSQAIIDELSLSECACIIHNIKGDTKADFIRENYPKINFFVAKITGENESLINIYKDLLISKGFVFKQETNINEDTKVIKKRIIKKRVINEKDLMDQKLVANAKIIINKKAILTPLANDFIRKNKIDIIREDYNENM